MQPFKFLFAGLLLLLVWFLTPVKEPDSFSSKKLVLDFKESPSFPISAVDEETLLSQKILNECTRFTYLGHGTQAIAFVSEDGSTVLKLFLRKKIQDPKIGFSPLRWIPSYRKTKEDQAKFRLDRRVATAFNAYAFASKEMKEETGLLSIHFHPTANLFPPCIVTDMNGNEHQIELDRASFVLQKRVTLVPEVFSHIQDPQEYARKVASIDTFFEKRAAKGIYDIRDDFPIDKNFGFLGEQLILLDPGRIAFSQEVKNGPEIEISRMKERLRFWLSWRFPLSQENGTSPEMPKGETQGLTSK